MRSDADQIALSVAVLAGGESRRMGKNKALIDFEGQPLAEHVAHGLREISDDVFVVSKKGSLDLSITEVRDELPDSTPLAGVLTALYTAKHPLVFIAACDMPFISTDVVRQLSAECVEGVDAVVPRSEGVLQPLHAVWSVDAAPKLEAMWTDGQRAVHRAMEGLEVRIVDIDDARSFVNVNTPGELAAIRDPN